jgi:hypothetical protein
MKNLFITFVLLISFVAFLGNDARADHVFVDLDTITDYQNLTFNTTDTAHLYITSTPVVDHWASPNWTIQGNCEIIITMNSFMYSNDNGSTWNTSYENTQGQWRVEWNMGIGIIWFNIYWTTPTTEPWVEEERFICNTADTLYASPDSYQEGIYYTWYKNGILESEGYYPSDTSLIITETGQYVLKTQGCNTLLDTIDITMVDNTPPDLGEDIRFCGDVNQPVLLLDFDEIAPIGRFNHWTWSNGSMGELGEVEGTLFEINEVGTYWVEAFNQCYPEGIRDSIEVSHIPYPPVEILGQTNICPGETTELCTNFDYDVSMWSQVTDTDTILLPNGSMTDCVTISDSMDVMVYVQQGMCPSEMYQVPIQVTTPYENNQICVATVDTNNYNKIIWDRTFDVAIESYNIYKLNSGGYENIGNVNIDEEPIFWDSISNPMTSASRYKISAIDTCGNESDLSFYHGTIHITVSPSYPTGIDLTITDEYLEESGSFFPSEYYIIIDSLNNGDFTVIDTLSAVFSSYHIENPYPAATYLLSVALPWDCSGAKSNNMSYSNKTAEIITEVSNLIEDNILMYPNPTSGNFHIEGSYINSVSINDITGKMIYEKEVNNNYIDIDLSGYSKSVYFVKLQTDDGVIGKRLILK